MSAEGTVDAEHPVHVVPEVPAHFQSLDDVRHVYVHPLHEEMARREVATRNLTQVELHVDPTCPPEYIYWCVDPLEDPT
jgi:hypothetical protein